MAMRTPFGGSADAFAGTAIGFAALTTSPFFSGLPSIVGMAAASAGGAWLGWRSLETYRKGNLLDSRLNLESSRDLSNPAGLLVGYRTDTGGPVYLPYASLRRHAAMQGGSGKGKTTLAMLFILQLMQRGGGLLFVDAKLDSEDLKLIYQFAAWCGRSQDLLVVNPGDPNESHTYNPILYGDPDEIADRILALIPASEDNPGADFYRQSAKQAVTTIVGAVQAAGLAYNFIDLSVLITNQLALSELEGRLKKHMPFHDATISLSLFLEQYKGGFGPGAKNSEMNATINIKRLKETLGGIGGRLHSFGTGTFGKVTSSYAPTVHMYKAIRENKIVVLRLPTMGKTESAFAFAKMAMADLRTALSWLQRLPESERPDPPFVSLMDEFGAWATPTMAQPMEQGRSAGTCFVPMFQTYGQMDKISVEFKQILNATTETKFFFGVGDQVGAEEAALLIGKTDIIKAGMSQSTRASVSTPKLAVTPDGGLSDDLGTSYTEAEEEVFRVTDDDIKKLPVGECIMLLSGIDIYHVRVPAIRITPDLAKQIGPVRITQKRVKAVKGLDLFKNAERYLSKVETKSQKSEVLASQGSTAVEQKSADADGQ